jgi:hypothetical protein
MIIYTTEDGLTKVETTFEGDTVWLSIDQMAELFERDKSTISRHIKNIFTEGELQRNSVVANFATTATDGKTYQVEYIYIFVYQQQFRLMVTAYTHYDKKSDLPRRLDARYDRIDEVEETVHAGE